MAFEKNDGNMGDFNKASERGGVNLRKESDAYGRTVRHFRLDVMNMTQEEFADAMGVSVSTLRNWEAGMSAVPKYFMRAMSVMESDPVRAMAAIDVYSGTTPADPPAWNGAVPSMDGMQARMRRLAVERLESDPGMSRAMDIADTVMAYYRNLMALGGDYQKVSPVEAMLLCNMVLLERLNNNVEALAGKLGK